MTDLSIPQAAGQVLIAGFQGPCLPKFIDDLIEQGELGGLILFRHNLESLEQCAGLLAHARSHSLGKAPILCSVDQEGGRVTRLPAPFFTLPSMRALASLSDPNFTEQCAFLVGLQLAALGFTMNFAPVLDVDTNPKNPVIGDRSFGRSPQEVILHANAFANGLGKAGILSCGKHFPGHGDTLVDSHKELPRLEHTLERLKEVELKPFVALADSLDAVMTAHILFPRLDADRPATVSKTILETLLRGHCRFSGCIISDDLDMKGICAHYGPGEAAVLAIEAGCDALLVCQQQQSVSLAHEALIHEAERSEPFAVRLQQAARRFMTMRQKQSARPGPVPLKKALTLADLASAQKRLEGSIAPS